MMMVYAMLLSLLAAVAPPAAAQSPAGQGAHADYEMYAHGLRIARVEAGFDLGARNYRMEIAYRTFGLLGFLFKGRQLSAVSGSWNGGNAAPAQFSGDGFWRGAVHRTILDYRDGRVSVRELTPSNADDEREEVPEAMRPGTIDTLSALTELVRVASATGKCELTLKTYDGRRLTQLTARTIGYEDLPVSGRSVFSGRALRCEFSGRLLAGFRNSDSAAERAHSRTGSAWLAQIVPDGPLLPVRMIFETPWFGDATMYLTASGAGGPQPSASLISA